MSWRKIKQRDERQVSGAERIEKAPWGWDTWTESKKEPATRKSERRASQAEETGSAKALQQDPAWYAQRVNTGCCRWSFANWGWGEGVVLGEMRAVIAVLTVSQCETVLHKGQSVIFTQAISFQVQNHLLSTSYMQGKYTHPSELFLGSQNNFITGETTTITYFLKSKWTNELNQCCCFNYLFRFPSPLLIDLVANNHSLVGVILAVHHVKHYQLI